MTVTRLQTGDLDGDGRLDLAVEVAGATGRWLSVGPLLHPDGYAGGPELSLGARAEVVAHGLDGLPYGPAIGSSRSPGSEGGHPDTGELGNEPYTGGPIAVDKKDQVRDFFGQHAAAYSVGPGHRDGPDLELLIRLLAPTGTEALLDVATATGNTAFALAPHVGTVTGLDLTPEMEGEFQAQAGARGVKGARFVLGDVERMDFAGGSFDLVTCRRAAHHFPNVATAVREMARVLRPGGKLGVVDMVAPDEPAAADLFNQMEIARDSSHVRALSPAEWRWTVEEAGLGVLALELTHEELPWNSWLFPVAQDGPEDRRAQALALRAAPDAGAHVVRREPDGRVTFLKRRVVLVAGK